MAVTNKATILIVLTRLLLFSCLTEAQPIELIVRITEENSPQAITRIEIDDVPRDVDLVFGKTYNLSCLSNTGFVGDTWYKLDSANNMVAVTTMISNNSSETSTYVYVKEDDNKILTLQNYAPSEMGTYVCFKNSECNKSVNLGEANPSIFTSRQELSLQKGTYPEDAAHQVVFITGDPRPNGTSVQWYKDGVQLTEELKSELSINILMTGALFFEGITDMKHAGNYTALVSNSAGVNTASLLVTVLIKPKLKLTVSPPTPILGNEFQIQCHDSEGDPLPQFSWFFDGDEIISGENGYMIHNQSQDVSVLNISQILFSHIGSYKCEATNTADTTTKTISVEVLLPSPSIPMINVISSNGSNYAGSVVTMKCVSTLQSSDLFNGELTAEFTWKKNGEDVDDADSRITISPLPENGLTFSSQLMLSLASSVVDSGSYTCEVKTTSSQYSSKVIESDTTELVVEVPPVNVVLTPTSVDIPNTTPYNSLNFTCTASVPDQITALTVFSWLMNGDETLEHGNGDVIIINDSMTSTLSLSPSNPGTVQVTCKFDVHLPSEDPILTLLHNATVIVRGPTPPVLPINIEAVHIEYNSTVIQWTTTKIAYTPESYYVKYGTSSNNLELRSATLKGSDILSTTDQTFEIKLTSLNHNTVYYYSVVSENQHESVESEILTFQTPKLALIQIKGGPFRGCNMGRVLDGPSVIYFLKEKVSETIREKCDCSFPKENLINGTLLCTETNSNTLIYRSYAIPTSELTSSQIITILEAWIKSEPAVVDVVAEISFDGTCNVSLSSLGDLVCTTPEEPTVGRVDETSGNTFESNTLILISGVMGGIIFVLIVVIIIVAVHSCTQYRRLRKMHKRKVSNNYLTVKRESSFVEPPPPRRTANRHQWEGDVSISDCPAYLYSYKPKTEEPPPIIERVPTPGIYDSIDNLSGRLNPRGIPNPIITQLENENSNETNDDSTGSSIMS